MLHNLHYILCQSSNEVDFYNGPLYQKVVQGFDGEVFCYGYNMSEKRKLTFVEKVKLCYSGGVKNSKRGDYVLLWGPGSFYLMAFNELLFLNRKIMFMNLIFNPDTYKHSLKKRISFLLYKYAFRTKRYYANVNAPGLSQMYAKLFNCKTSCFPVVFDSMEVSQALCDKADSVKERFYVFCGGRAERDVECFVKIVRQMPDVQFMCVFNKNMVTKEMYELPNLEIYSDLSLNDFNDKLAHASICCIPLKSKAPCGLLVMQRAALLGIPIVSTETYSMRTVVPSDDYGFLCQRGDVDAYVQKIRFLMRNPELYANIAQKAKENMKFFTKEEVGKQICHAVNSMIG